MCVPHLFHWRDLQLHTMVRKRFCSTEQFNNDTVVEIAACWFFVVGYRKNILHFLFTSPRIFVAHYVLCSACIQILRVRMGARIDIRYRVQLVLLLRWWFLCSVDGKVLAIIEVATSPF